ncbi:L-aspartate oxidase [Paeniglutamicibacter sp. NPDC012692]|uniref:L-aspartate oxidase n=1 Tax=Paeniglutamicibacter sp. NPDC012692 TaxID=3364388 RepID=UPI0036962E03
MTAAPLNAAPLGAAPRRATGLLVVGSGVAGLYAALTAATRGLEVTLLTKDNLENSNSWFAQGGLSAVGPAGVSRGDSVASHVADTLTAGARLNDAAAVAAMCGAAWDHVERLTGAGAVFDADPDGGYALGLEAAHAHARILHAGGDATGKALASALIGACLRQEAAGTLRIRERAFVTDLLMQDAAEPERITGVRVLNADGTTEELTADAVLLATGGVGNLFAATTNPHGATGDGAALAYRAGALLVDSEFVQFHPTLVSPGGFMVSEAVRGEGAILVDQNGHRFMPDVHPDAELAPRDVVARAIHTVNAAGGQAYLDATGVEAARGPGFLARRFPSITAALAKLGHDLAAAPVPVTEAAHYWMGGVFTDGLGRTTLPGLYAAGEAACTGVHGANRLASNSLLEALVFAWSAVANLPAAGASAVPADHGTADTSTITTHTLPAAEPTAAAGSTPVNLPALQRLATGHLGVERTGADLEGALRQLSLWHVEGTDRAAHELGNLHTLAHVMATAALARENSIGAHFRLDAPWQPEPANGTLPRHGFRQATPSQANAVKAVPAPANADTANSTSQLVSSNIGS